MAKDKYFFPFFYKDWLIKTKKLSNEMKGIYIDLICYDFDYGGLPNDDKAILNLINYRGRNSKAVTDFVRANFALVNKDSTYVLRNKTVIEVTNKINGISEERSKAANLRWEKANAIALQKQSKEHAKKDKVKELNKESIKKHPFTQSPFFEYENFKAEWIRLGDIKADINYSPEYFNLEIYHQNAVEYTKGMYDNWVVAVRNWVRRDILNSKPIYRLAVQNQSIPKKLTLEEKLSRAKG